MSPVEGLPILTASGMRAAEDRAIAAGSSAVRLMDSAGAGVAEAVRRLAAGAPVLVLCGPGNNGGDGYVAARLLRANGADVRVAAASEPGSEAAAAARAAWTGPVETAGEAAPAAILVDALFGTGLSRPPDPAIAHRLVELTCGAGLSIAVDLPSGVASDTGAASPDMASFDLTLALGALKPAHVLWPGAGRCGAVRLLDIGLDIGTLAASADWTMRVPTMAVPTGSDHKYSRGMIVVVGGAMPGAAALAAQAALHAGAGYVLLFGDGAESAPPHALVRRRWSTERFDTAIHGKARGKTAIVVGPGLGTGGDAAEKLDRAIASGLPLVVDGDALRMLDDAAFARFKDRPAGYPVVLTPHEGEFKAVFGDRPGSKIDAARAAAARSGAIVVFKGSDTVVAYPGGRTTTALHASPWLSTAGTGDVLAGTIAAMLTAATPAPVEAGVWLHAAAARRLGGAFVADDLARELSAVRAAL